MLRTKKDSYLYFFLLTLLLSFIFPQKSFSGCGFSKTMHIRDVLEERFEPKNCDIILKQHPKLTPSVATEILQIIDQRENKVENQEELLSLFSLYASIRVGFKKINGNENTK